MRARSAWPRSRRNRLARVSPAVFQITTPSFPGFNTVPIYNFLEDALDPNIPGRRLTWKCYFTDLPFLAFWYKFAAYHAETHFSHVGEFVTDWREDRLPTVSIIDPSFALADDHPSHNPRWGRSLPALLSMR